MKGMILKAISPQIRQESLAISILAMTRYVIRVEDSAAVEQNSGVFSDASCQDNPVSP